MAADVLRGNGAVPVTLNRYGYCWNQPLNFADVDGKFPWLILPVVMLGAAALSGCGIKEEDLVPMPPASGDYEYVNSPEVYNSKEYLRYTNCYAYALDIIENPLTGEKFIHSNDRSVTKPWGTQPGLLSGQYSTHNYGMVLGTGTESRNVILKLLKDDGEAIGLTIQEYEEGMEGGYMIAMAVDVAKDYHFYRRDNDGKWSGKIGED